MDRRSVLRSAAALGLGWSTGFALPHRATARPFALRSGVPLTRDDFGEDFRWGTATSAYQIEGAWDAGGKGPSIWDSFTHETNRVEHGATGDVACDFYHRYRDDLGLVRDLGFDAFRFSLSWSRLIPDGDGDSNPAGFAFYDRVIDRCLELGVEPWVTCYHWDLPQALEERGGWRNRDVVGWFEDYVGRAARAFGDRVRHWMVLNEPLAFTLLGYGSGVHAPGRRGWRKFCRASHHVALAQAAGGRILRHVVPGGVIGTTFSTSSIDAVADRPGHRESARILDAVVNRMFLESALGLGYPFEAAPALRRMEAYIEPGDMDRLAFDFDFHGLQNYTRIVARHIPVVPWLKSLPQPPGRRENDGVTEMGWEVYPEGIRRQIMQFAAYGGVRRIVVTENGAAFPDRIEGGRIRDAARRAFFEAYLAEVLQAKREGAPVDGYFVWTLMDNFEWAEGYRPRFGIVHVDFETQKRTVKDSGFWFRDLLQS